MTTAWHDFPSPGLIPQGDGSTFQWSNCAAATWAGLVVSQQQGKRPAKGSPWYPTGASLRQQSGDRSGGITPSLLDATVIREYGIDLDVRIASLSVVRSRLAAGYAVGVLIGYGPIADAGLSGSPGFRGAHSIGLYGDREIPNGTHQWLDADPLYDGRRAGIPKGPQWVAESTIVKAAGSLVLDGSGTTVRQRYGSGMLYVVLTTVPYHPPVQLVESAPASAAERTYPMIAPAWSVTSGKVQRLPKGQPLFRSPGGPRVTRMSRTASVTYVGKAGRNWSAVLVQTGSPYADKVTRPTVLYVPLAAGPVTNR